eukprot:scpid82705/ scgid1108/ Radical S-adenosyl methionine domain-containing protein 1, mitochondrial; Oxygen-independent coproporphyrinogen-III oxidase-like protein RSAD1
MDVRRLSRNCAFVFPNTLRYRQYKQAAVSFAKLSQQPPEAIAVYVHWPFCRQLCSYCNFNKYVRSVDKDFEQSMVECILQDAAGQLKASGASDIFSIYFGGGTPSLCSASSIHSIIAGLGRLGNIVPDAEVTLEANPSSSTDNKLRSFRDAGVNRISLGVQALNNEDLQLLNRDHTVEESLRTIESCQQIYPSQTSLDLIFARPAQTLQQWQSELEQVLQLCETHVSLYELTIEQSTPLARQVEKGELTVPGSDVKADMYQCAIETLSSHGLYRYQVSNFAKPGCEAQHNSSYWYGRPYIGLGPGAHGRYKRHPTLATSLSDRYSEAAAGGGSVRSAGDDGTLVDDKAWHHCVQVPEPNAWMTQVKATGSGAAKCTPVQHIDMLQQVLISSLYTDAGLSHETWCRVGSSHSLADIFQPVLSKRTSPLADR